MIRELASSRRARIVWFTVLVTVIVVAEWRFVPVARDIVTYAQTYADGHVRAYGWSQSQYVAFVAKSYVLNFGFLLALALIPMILFGISVKKRG
ncbi:MAG: hypothetical protein M1358_23235 [Chloroflexi bacterium]|nr:hypothetical protein [Chloroflexota bacterium]